MYQNELSLLKEYQSDAAGYLSAQIKEFPQKALRFQKLTLEINQKFKQMDWKQKIAYQKKWQKQFNPVVKQIELSSRTLLSESAKKLSESQKAQLARLKIEISVLQKKSNAVELLPQLFDLET